jgi:hypothetical protein
LVTKQALEAAWMEYLNYYLDNSSGLFSTVVGVSDKVLAVKNNVPAQDNDKARFYNIAKDLPIELQMVLCKIAYGSTKKVIPAVKTTDALVHLFNKRIVDVLFKSKGQTQEVQNERRGRCVIS